MSLDEELLNFIDRGDLPRVMEYVNNHRIGIEALYHAVCLAAFDYDHILQFLLSRIEVDLTMPFIYACEARNMSTMRTLIEHPRFSKVNICLVICRTWTELDSEIQSILLTLPGSDAIFKNPFINTMLQYGLDINEPRLNWDTLDRIKILEMEIVTAYPKLVMYPDTLWLMIQDSKYENWTKPIMKKLEDKIPHWRNMLTDSDTLQRRSLQTVIANF